MLGQPSSVLSRNGIFRTQNFGQKALAIVRNLCFALFVIGVLFVTILALNYSSDDPLLQPFSKITNYLTSTSNATIKSDNSLVKTGEDFLASNQSEFETFFNTTEIEGSTVNRDCGYKIDDPVNCREPDVFHILMRAAMDRFEDVHFYRFGKPVRGDNDSSCHMAWRYRPKEGKADALYKDYRSFTLVKSENCTLSLVGIGEYHSGENARKGKEKVPEKIEDNPIALPEVGEIIDDEFSIVTNEGSFSRGKYLIYSGGGDRCKSMHQYLWSFTCMLGEAQYLNRTLVLDMSICLSKIHTSSNLDEEGKDFRFYFDFEHLLDSASVLDQAQFWSNWNKWQEKDGLTLHLVEDSRVTPMKLAGVNDALIVRKFGSVEPDNYWHQVCEGEAKPVIDRPWRMVWKARHLLDVAAAIAARMSWDFDSIHIERGEKAANKELWPNLDKDTSPETLLSTLREKIEDGRNLYIASDEPNNALFDPLKEKYSTHFLDEHKDLWDVNSDWYAEMTKLSNGNPFEFDNFMRDSVDTEVFIRAKRHFETFNDLTKDCKDGIHTC